MRNFERTSDEWHLNKFYNYLPRFSDENWVYHLVDGTPLSHSDSIKLVTCLYSCKNFFNGSTIRFCDSDCPYKVDIDKYLKEEE